MLLILLVLAFFLYEYGRDLFIPSDSFDEIIREAGDRHCVDYLLIKAVIWRESRFNTLARGAKGEIGLMQLRPNSSVLDWARSNCVEPPSEAALFSPRLNIEIGTWYLAKALRKWSKYKDFEAIALAEYNAGGTNAQKWKSASYEDDFIEKITYGNTKIYVKDILERYREYAINREAK